MVPRARMDAAQPHHDRRWAVGPRGGARHRPAGGSISATGLVRQLLVVACLVKAAVAVGSAFGCHGQHARAPRHLCRQRIEALRVLARPALTTDLGRAHRRRVLGPQPVRPGTRYRFARQAPEPIGVLALLEVGQTVGGPDPAEQVAGEGRRQLLCRMPVGLIEPQARRGQGGRDVVQAEPHGAADRAGIRPVVAAGGGAVDGYAHHAAVHERVVCRLGPSHDDGVDELDRHRRFGGDRAERDSVVRVLGHDRCGGLTLRRLQTGVAHEMGELGVEFHVESGVAVAGDVPAERGEHLVERGRIGGGRQRVRCWVGPPSGDGVGRDVAMEPLRCNVFQTGEIGQRVVKREAIARPLVCRAPGQRAPCGTVERVEYRRGRCCDGRRVDSAGIRGQRHHDRMHRIDDPPAGISRARPIGQQGPHHDPTIRQSRHDEGVVGRVMGAVEQGIGQRPVQMDARGPGSPGIERRRVVRQRRHRDGGLRLRCGHDIGLHVCRDEHPLVAGQHGVPGLPGGQVDARAGERGEPRAGHHRLDVLGRERHLGHAGPRSTKAVWTYSAYPIVGVKTAGMVGFFVAPNTCRYGKRISCSAYSAASRPSPAPVWG